MSTNINELEDLHWKHDLLGSIEVGILVLDRDFRVKVWNQFMENHSGIQPSKIINNVIFDYFPDIDREWFAVKSDPVFRLRSPAFIIWEQRHYVFKMPSYRPITGTTSSMYQNVTMFPLASLSGEVEQMCVVVYDVTDEAVTKQNLAQANRQLEHISRVDGLTGVFNRRYWEEQCRAEFKRSKRTEIPAALIILDIDKFKSINDTYGHPAGDQVIRKLAQIIKKAIRETDIAGRYGGEEFTVLLPDTNSRSARLVAERIRKLTEKLPVEYEGQQICFTVSLGVAEFHTSYVDHMAWVEQADKGLYQAKEGGRNQSVVV